MRRLDASNRVLVTGATGFIGQRLTSALIARNVAVVVLTRHAAGVPAEWKAGRLSVKEADLLNPATVSGLCEGIDTLFHLASYSEEPGNDIVHGHQRLSVDGSRALLGEAERAGVRRFVYVSSVKAMGEGTQGCADERTEPHPVSPYGKAKLQAEYLVTEAQRTNRVEASILRLPMVYGLNPKVNIFRMIAGIDRQRFPPLPETGNKRSMVHIDDVVQAVILAAEQPAAKGQTYIVTDGQPYSTRQIYEAICQALGRPVPKWAVPVAVLRLAGAVGDFLTWVTGKNAPISSAVVEKLLGSAWYSCEKIQVELGYRPSRHLFSAIPEMVAQYRAGFALSTGPETRGAISGSRHR